MKRVSRQAPGTEPASGGFSGPSRLKKLSRLALGLLEPPRNRTGTASSGGVGVVGNGAAATERERNVRLARRSQSAATLSSIARRRRHRHYCSAFFLAPKQLAVMFGGGVPQLSLEAGERGPQRSSTLPPASASCSTSTRASGADDDGASGADEAGGKERRREEWVRKAQE